MPNTQAATTTKPGVVNVSKNRFQNSQRFKIKKKQYLIAYMYMVIDFFSLKIKNSQSF